MFTFVRYVCNPDRSASHFAVDQKRKESKSMAPSGLSRRRSEVTVRGGHLRLLPDPNDASWNDLICLSLSLPSLCPSLICAVFRGGVGGRVG